MSVRDSCILETHIDLGLKQRELIKNKEVIIGKCNSCGKEGEFYYDTNNYLKCKECHSMNVEIVQKIINS
jgi:Zn finger protein HypA/HybF involved in hydrogenase expression